MSGAAVHGGVGVSGAAVGVAPPAERHVNALIEAMAILRDCGITRTMRGIMRRDAVTRARAHGTAAQRAAIAGLDRWLAEATAYEAVHGVGSKEDHGHEFMQLLLRTSRSTWHAQGATVGDPVHSSSQPSRATSAANASA